MHGPSTHMHGPCTRPRLRPCTRLSLRPVCTAVAAVSTALSTAVYTCTRPDTCYTHDRIQAVYTIVCTRPCTRLVHCREHERVHSRIHDRLRAVYTAGRVHVYTSLTRLRTLPCIGRVHGGIHSGAHGRVHSRVHDRTRRVHGHVRAVHTVAVYTTVYTARTRP